MKNWKIIAAVSVIALSLMGCGSNNNNNAAGSDSGAGAGNTGSGEEKAITVDASNFLFEPEEIRVKKGDTVTITLANKEGNHGMAIPDLNVDIKKNNGTATFKADKAGEFEIICSVMCGAGHSDMTSKLIVEE